MTTAQRHEFDNFDNFVSKCKKYVNNIRNYSGDDPLQPWYEYLMWFEENFVVDFEKNTPFEDVLADCLSRFENSEQYKQDRRLIKLFIKFIHFQDDQSMFYEAMLENGFGNKVADLYINWAFHFDWKGNFLEADTILQRGLTARAEPYDLLRSTHENFRYSMSQRLLYASNEQFQRENQTRMHKQFQKITSLRIDGPSNTAPKSCALQKFDKAILVSHCIPYPDTQEVTPEKPHNTSVAKTIIDSARKMRRDKSQASTPAAACRLDFNENACKNAIPLLSGENLYEKGIQLDRNFKSKNLPQRLPPTRAYFDPEIGTYRKELPAYDKIMLVPAENLAFSLEELRAYNWFKKRSIENAFTKEQDKIWGVGYDVPVRWPIVFGRSNFPQSEWKVARISESGDCDETGPHKFYTNMAKIYPKHSTEEYQIEEIMWQKRKTQKQIPVAIQVCKGPAPTKTIRPNVNDSKLSPITEMELSGYEDAIKGPPRRRRDSLHPNLNIEPSKKRKSSIFPTFDALNDTCTTQMFGNLLSSTAISTPKMKMPKLNEAELNFKPCANESLSNGMAKSGKNSMEQSNQANDHGFAIYEDKTQTINAIKHLACKETVGNSSVENKENILESRKINLEQTKPTAPTKISAKHLELSIINSNAQRSETSNFKHLDEQNEQKDRAQPLNAYPFDIFTDKTENMANIVENARKMAICDSTMQHKENLIDNENKSAHSKTIEEEVASINQIINSILGGTKTEDSKRGLSKTFTTSMDSEIKSKVLSQIEAEEREAIQMVKTVQNILKNEESFTHDQSVFKQPITPNRSNKSLNPQKSTTSFAHELDSTAEFERIEAECANSPTLPLDLPQPNLHKSFDWKCVFDKTVSKNNSKNPLQLSVYLSEAEQRNILQNSDFCDRTKLNWTRRQTLVSSAESSPAQVQAMATASVPTATGTSALTMIRDDQDKNNTSDQVAVKAEPEDDDIGKSIYIKQEELHFDEKDADWHEVTQFLSEGTATNEYKVEEVHLDETRTRIDTFMLNMKDLNPFDPDMQKDVLNDLGFLDLLNGANNFNCILMNIVQPLKPRLTIEVNGRKYKVCKLIGSGSFGKVFSAECTKTKELLALKQQRPPNLWEYYVCLEIHSRITDQHIRNGFMSVDFAVIGNNATIYASKFSKYGTILNVCNKVKQTTNKNIDECIVMILAKQMLTIIEHCHKAKFIHGDVKPDNFLLMDKLSLNYGNPEIVLQLIDFGQSIDMNYFNNNHVFWTKVKTENFICTEMMEDKPWTYHCDLFCLASTFYTMVAAKYMVVTRDKSTGKYKPQKLPRYVNTELWDQVFDTLINIPSLKRMPSLSKLQELLDAELMAIGPRKVTEAINRFNKALD